MKEYPLPGSLTRLMAGLRFWRGAGLRASVSWWLLVWRPPSVPGHMSLSIRQLATRQPAAIGASEGVPDGMEFTVFVT